MSYLALRDWILTKKVSLCVMIEIILFSQFSVIFRHPSNYKAFIFYSKEKTVSLIFTIGNPGSNS